MAASFGASARGDRTLRADGPCSYGMILAIGVSRSMTVSTRPLRTPRRYSRSLARSSATRTVFMTRRWSRLVMMSRRTNVLHGGVNLRRREETQARRAAKAQASSGADACTGRLASQALRRGRGGMTACRVSALDGPARVGVRADGVRVASSRTPAPGARSFDARDRFS